MRPLVQPPDAAPDPEQGAASFEDGKGYSKDAALADEIEMMAPTSEAKLRRVEPMTRAAAVDLLEAFLSEQIDAEGDWKSRNAKHIADRMQQRIGKRYRLALRDLLSVYGPVCALCGTRQSSGMVAEPGLPPARFPTQAYALPHLLPLCEACAEFASRGLRRAMDAPSSIEALSDIRFWPYADCPTPDPPFQAVIVQYQAGATSGVELRGARLHRAVRAYTLGLLEVETGWHRPGALRFDPPDARPVYLISELRPGGPAGPSPEAAERIETARLNVDPDLTFIPFLDRRRSARTLTHLRALAMRAALDAASGAGFDAPPALERLVTDAMKSSGHWPVWLSVFGDVPGFQPVLEAAFPGTQTGPWRSR